MVTATTTIMPKRQRLADVRPAEHDLAREEGADAQRHQRARLRDQRLGGGVGREGIGEQQQRGAEEGWPEDREADVAPVAPRIAAEALAGLAPLRPQPVERGQEDDDHQRDLEVGVDQSEARQLVDPASPGESVDAQPVMQEQREEAVEAERGEEGEREHDAAELGERTRTREHDPAQQAVRAADRDRPRQQAAEDRARYGGDRGQHGRGDEGLQIGALQRLLEIAQASGRLRGARTRPARPGRSARAETASRTPANGRRPA